MSGEKKMLRQSDLMLISQLRRNARQTLTEISKKTKIPISTLFDKLKIHEENIIMKHTTIIDFSKLGLNCRANVLLKTSREERDRLISYMKACPAINNLYKINNGFDILGEFVFHNVKDLEEFFEELESKFKIEDKKTYYIIDELRREEFDISKPIKLIAES